jgi:DMSO reductase anchor subunit
MIPMVFMTAIDIFLASFIPSPGIIIAYMMSEVYARPSILVSIFWESTIGFVGLYIFAVVLGCWIAVKEGAW